MIIGTDSVCYISHAAQPIISAIRRTPNGLATSRCTFRKRGRGGRVIGMGAIVRTTNNLGETPLLVAVIVDESQDKVDLIIHYANDFGRRCPKPCIPVC
jgi:hypothetical protein